jgi:NAD(P)-dependent dehydrogenase (short-subunit alcohol dehydrogenase family)
MNHRTKITIAATGLTAGLVAKALYDRSKERSITGDVVLVTGGAGGLWLAVARRFAREGCRVAICGRDAEELSSARQELASRGADPLAVRCDAALRPEVESAIAEVTRHFGRIDILVNVAEQVELNPEAPVTIGDFERAMQSAFWSLVYPTLTALPDLVRRNGGRIVNVTAIGAPASVGHSLPYTSAQHAAASFSDGLREELAESGVTVTAFAPVLRGGADATRAARDIVTAVKRGEGEKAPAGPAKIPSPAPGMAGDLLSLAGSLLHPKSAKGGMRAALLLGRLAARHLKQRTA